VLAGARGLRAGPPQAAAELKQMAGHGAHELAAALFNGSAFVMYPRGTADDHGVHGPETPGHAQPDPGLGPDAPDRQHDRGGRSL
jgi:hypothetical protein